MIVNKQNLALLQASYSGAFKRGLDGVKGQYQKFTTQVPSGTATNVYPFLGDSQSLRQWVGDRVIQNLKQHSYSLSNLDFELTVGVDRNDIEDDQYGVYSMSFETMGDSAGRHPDELVYAQLLLGISQTCYDGQFFFDTDHPVSGGTASNYDSAGGGGLWFLMDTTRPLKPMIFQTRKPYSFQQFTSMSDESVFMSRMFKYGVDARVNAGYGLWQLAYASANTLNATNVDSYLATMMALTSEEGKKLGVSPNLLVVGPSRMAAAQDLVTKQYDASGASNRYYQRFELVVSPYLT